MKSIGWIDGGREGCNCCMVRLLLLFGPPFSCYLLFILEQLDTVHIYSI